MRSGRSLSSVFVVLAIVCLLAQAACATPVAVVPAHPRNLFTELLGKSETDVSVKINAAWQQLFYGDDTTERVYYPVGDDLAYIADIGSHDVRSEGMSYGMMIAVQLDKKAEFDRLWKWANKYMRHASGPRRGYFAWHCKFDGTQIDSGSASDGEEWFAMALFFAAHRWGNGRAVPNNATFGHPPGEPSPSARRLSGDASPYPPKSNGNYEAEAQTLLRDMLHQRATSEVIPIFNRKEKQVVFVPNPHAGYFTDPSYHLPAFYELWAQWSTDTSDQKFWNEAAQTSRTFFHRAAHPITGLMPEYANFDGSPFTENKFGAGKGDFRFDAWRTLANVALDHAWFAADPWQVEQSNRVLRFLTDQGTKIPNQFTLDGKPLSKDEAAGLSAMAAVAGLAADPALARPFVQRLWDLPIPSGQWRYYNGMLYMLALLEVGGEFQIHQTHPKL